MPRALSDSDGGGAADERTGALLRLDLFGGLGRLDLAKLAGELAECSFAPGETIFAEGDPPDALYIIRSGEVVVHSQDFAGIATLGPGQIFGEMGLIAAAPRSASIVAESTVAAWSLSRDRFLALLDKERSIAAAVERTLAARVADTSGDLVAYRRQTRGAIDWALGNPGSRSRTLMRMLSLLPSWDLSTVRDYCCSTGYGDDFENLLDGGTLLQSEPNRLAVIAPLLWERGELPSGADTGWLRGLADAHLAGGDVAAAIDLLILLGDSATAKAAIEANWPTLRDTVSPARASTWREKLPGAAIAVDAATVSVIDKEAGRPGYALLAAQADRAPARAAAAKQSLVDLPGKKILGLALAAVLYGAGWVVAPSDQLGRSALVALFTVAAFIPLLTFDVLPLLAVAALIILAMVVPHAVPADIVLSGFASPAFLTIVSLFAVSEAVGRSGLGFRIALAAVRRLPASFVAHSLFISAIGALLTGVVSSGSARMMMAAPAVREISSLLGFPKQSRHSAALGLVTYFSFSGLSALFITGSVSLLMVFYLMPESTRQDVSWLSWFLVALVPMGVIFASFYVLVLFLYRPRVTRPPDRTAADMQRDLLGPMSRSETTCAIVLILLGIGFAGKDLHSIPVAWVAVSALVVLVVTGQTTASSFARGIPWPVMLYTAVLLGFGAIFRELHIDAWLGTWADRVPEWLFKNPYGFVFVFSATAWVLAFVLSLRVLAPVLALIAMPIAAATDVNVMVPLLVMLIAGNHAFLPALDEQYLNFYFAVDGELFTQQQVKRTLQIAAVLRLAVVVAAVPYFQLLGLM